MDKSILKKQIDIQQACRKLDEHLSSDELEKLKKLFDDPKICYTSVDDDPEFQEEHESKYH